MSGNRQNPWVPTSLNGDDQHRTPKHESRHLPKSSQRPRHRPSNIHFEEEGTANDPIDFVKTPQRREPLTTPSLLSGVKSGEGVKASPFTISDSEDESMPKSKGQSRPGALPSRLTPPNRSTPTHRANTNIAQGSSKSPPVPEKPNHPPEKTNHPPEKPNPRSEKSKSQPEEPPIQQVPFTKHMRKSQPEPSPAVLFMQRDKQRKERERRGRELYDDDDSGTVGQIDSPIKRVEKRLVRERTEESDGLLQHLGKTNGDDQLPTMKRRQSQAASMAQWSQCTACKEAGIVCDGESPCAYCGDVIDCDNPTKSSPRAFENLLPSVKDRTTAALTDPPLSASDISGDSSDADSKTASVLGEILFDIGFFEQQVLKFQKEMVGCQEYLVQRILSQERTAAKRAPGPVLKAQQSSPFANLKPQTTQLDSVFSLQVRDGPSSGMTNKSAPPKSVESPITTMVTDMKSLPRYKSIGRLGPLPLTRNVTIGKYNPYFPEDEVLPEAFRASKYQDIRDSYKSYEMFSDTLHDQRDCVELSAMWHSFALDLIRSVQIDVTSIAMFFQSDTSTSHQNLAAAGVDDAALAACLEAQTFVCSKCNIGTEAPWDLKGLWDGAKTHLDKSARLYAIAGLLSYAFQKVTGLKLWHVIRGCSTLRKCLEEQVVLHDELTRLVGASNFCLVCGLNNCPSHGAYRQGIDLNEDKVLINDPEYAMNVHSMVIRPKRIRTDAVEHLCGVFCVEGLKEDGSTVRGLHKDGEVRGEFRGEMENSRSSFDARAFCGSDSCFWDVEGRKMLLEDPGRPKTKTDLTATQQRAFGNCLEMFLGNERGPCMAKDLIPGVSCANIFFLMLDEIKAREHCSRPPLATRDSQRSRKGKSRPRAKADKQERPVFLPCNHNGPCQDNLACTCFKNGVDCEYTCGCETSCDRRFHGCECRTGPGQICMENKCPCWESSRECDPWLCGPCGIVEVLDPVNKYNEDIRNGRCKNSALQLGLPARTIKAPSEVQGYGLFAGQDIAKNGFIGEYKGEVTSRIESDRRGITYHLSGMEYLFNLNQEQEIDAANFGNKTRFMNNSSEEQNINVLGATMRCNGMQRVMLYAKRDIKAGEELLYDYAYPDHVREKFWERGQKPASKNAMVVAPGSKRTTGKGRREKPKDANGYSRRKNKAVDDSDDEVRPPAHNRKRKRRDDDLEVAQNADGAVDFSVPLPVIDASDDSDYDGTAENSVVESEESQEGIPESDSEEDAETSMPRGATRRKAGAGDRRRGGEAQSRAWETRKKNLASGGR